MTKSLERLAVLIRINGQVVGYLHFQGSAIVQVSEIEIEYRPLLMLECLDSLKPDKVLEILSTNPDILDILPVLRNRGSKVQRTCFQIQYNTNGEFEPGYKSFLNARVRWLEDVLSGALEKATV